MKYLFVQFAILNMLNMSSILYVFSSKGYTCKVNIADSFPLAVHSNFFIILYFSLYFSPFP